MTTYTLSINDNKENIYFNGNAGVDVVIPINGGVFPRGFNTMLTVSDVPSITLLADPGVDLEVDIPQISKPNDLFYLINLDGFNTWRAVRASNFISIASNRELLLDTKELISSDPAYQFLGSKLRSVDVILPDPPSINDRFVIKNIFQDSFELRIKETLTDINPIVVLGPSSLRYVAECIYDGIEWQIILL